MTIEEAQKSIDNWIRTVGIAYFPPLTNMVLLTEEMGELARVMARHYGEQSFKDSEDAIRAPEMIAEEMADVLFVLLCLANQCEVDLTSALEKSLDKKTKRDAIRHQNNPKLKDS
ncbi:MAG TPA: nucleotide pyrophosphohydrolase [Saprospiraceae bacterium]|nr:nucleotide pyrophosphohydrolase [Saprospiraceae bacterium]MCB9270618.1 nucleotide pyrophosphohydrolase [Lewinellaceae bacterium]HPG06012.1 nucleotide pyrophosphohydrolase [Saprospiraceae bacterium]HPR00009.1 nucleotide pyrophosphohydrolase [Saprospiraceae bacterium]HRV83540.1 nucleotide pyrophosphohydrolase [Saprospiraceae bacterium]